MGGWQGCVWGTGVGGGGEMLMSSYLLLTKCLNSTERLPLEDSSMDMALT